MSREDMLANVVRNASEPVFMNSKSQLVEYYKDQYGKNWTGHIASALAGTSDKKSKEYKSAIRHFQGDRLAKEGKKSGGMWKSLGEKLPPVGLKPKDGSISVTVRGNQGTRSRVVHATFRGADAQAFINKPSYWQVYYQSYGDADLADMFDNEGGMDDDSITGITVVGVSAA
jgi:hypothetical protein